MNETLGKHQRIKERDLIKQIFKEGKSVKSFPLKVIYLPVADVSEHKMAVSVPKRNFKKAVDRNHLKRLVREAYRKNKPENLTSNYALFFIFMGRKKVSYSTVEQNLKILVQKLG